MALGFAEESMGGQITSQNVMGTLRCGNPECNHVVAQVHTLGLGIFRVLDCAKCHRATEYENTARGWTVRMLPQLKQQTARR